MIADRTSQLPHQLHELYLDDPSRLGFDLEIFNEHRPLPQRVIILGYAQTPENADPHNKAAAMEQHQRGLKSPDELADELMKWSEKLDERA